MDNLPIEFPSFFKPLFPFPSLFLLTMWKRGSSHHFCQFLGYPSLKSINEDVIDSDAALGLSKPKCCHIVVKIPIVVLVHGGGIELLVSSIHKLSEYEGLGEVLI